MDHDNEALESQPISGPAKPTRHRYRFWRRRKTGKNTSSGQAIVEFAIVSTAFFMMVFGTIDFGRSIFMYSQLHNAVREGARYGKIMPSDQTGIKQRVVDYSSSLKITTADVTVSCNPSGCASGVESVEVKATSQFQAVTQNFLHIKPITLTAKAKVVAE